MGYLDKVLRALCFGHAGRAPRAGVNTSEGVRGSPVELEQQAHGPLPGNSNADTAGSAGPPTHHRASGLPGLTDSASQHAVLLEVAHPTTPAPVTLAAAAVLGDTKAPLKTGIDRVEQQELASTASNLLATESSSPRPLNIKAKPSPVSQQLSINSAEPAAGVTAVHSQVNDMTVGSAVPTALHTQAGSESSELQEPEPPSSAPAAERRLRRHVSEPVCEIFPADRTVSAEGGPYGDDGQQQRSRAPERAAAEPAAGSQSLRTPEPRSRRQRQGATLARLSSALTSALAAGADRLEVSRPLARLQQLAARDGPAAPCPDRSPAQACRQAPAMLLVPVYGSSPSAGTPSGGGGHRAGYPAAASPPADPGALLQKLATYFSHPTNVADGQSGCDGASSGGLAQHGGLLGFSSPCAGGGAASTTPHDASQMPRQQRTAAPRPPRSAGSPEATTLSNAFGFPPGSRARSASTGSNVQPPPRSPGGAGASRLCRQPTGACTPTMQRMRRAATWQALGSPTPAANRDPTSWSMTQRQPSNGIESIGMILKLHRLCHVIEPRQGPGPRPSRGPQGSQGPAKHASPLRGRSAVALGTPASRLADPGGAAQPRQVRSGSLGNQS